jgi:hypothetical protein
MVVSHNLSLKKVVLTSIIFLLLKSPLSLQHQPLLQLLQKFLIKSQMKSNPETTGLL